MIRKKKSHSAIKIMKNYHQLICKPAILLTLPVMLINSAIADTSWRKTISPFKPGPHRAIKPVQLTYNISWNGLFKAGKVSIVFGKPDERYTKKGIFVSQLYGQAGNKVVPFQFTTTSFTKDKTFNPILVISTEKDKRETVTSTNKYTKKGVFHESKTTENKTGGLVDTGKRVFKEPVAHDTLSAMLYIRGQKLVKGETHKFITHPERSGFLVTAKSHGVEMYEDKECIKISVSMVEIDKRTYALKDYKKLNQSATMWLTNDADRIPYAFKAKLKLGKLSVGSIKASLTAKQKP